MIVKAHRRTIKIKIEGKIYKFLLNLPKLEFTIYHFPGETNSHYLCKAYNEKGQQCYVPLFNVDVYDTICMGNVKPQNEEDLANSFFNSFFTTEIKSSVYRILTKTKQDFAVDFVGSTNCYLNFFEDWQKTGICKLVVK